MDAKSAISETRNYISMAQAAGLTPGRPSPATIWRWARRGIKTHDGERVRLRYARVGGRIYTTAPWLHTFFDQLAAADLPAGTTYAQLGPARPSMSHAIADATLNEGGL